MKLRELILNKLKKECCKECKFVTFTDWYTGGSTVYICTLTDNEVDPLHSCKHFRPLMVYTMEDGVRVGRYAKD